VGWPATDRSHHALSDMQVSMLAHEALADRPIYTMPLCFRLTGELDVARLEDALSQVVARHPVLYARYESTQAIVDKSNAVARLELVNEAELGVDALVTALLDTPMDLVGNGSFRAVLASRSTTDHSLILAVHHVAGDSWSLGLLLEDVSRAYIAGGEAGAPAGPDRLNFFDFSASESVRGGHTEWWATTLRGLSPQSFPRVPAPHEEATSALISITLDLDARRTKGIRDLARSIKVSPVAVLLTALSLSLSGPEGEHESVIGVPAILRGSRDAEQVIGPLLNTLPVRTAWDHSTGVAGVVRAHAEALGAALEHKDVPFSRILKAAKIRRRPGTAPLFLHVLNVDTVVPRLRLTGVRCTWVPIAPRWAIFPAMWDFSWGMVGNIKGTLRASEDAFTREQALDCSTRFRDVLDSLLEQAPREAATRPSHLGDPL
jgi:hypothetical protein